MLQWRLVQTIPVYTLLSPVRQAGWQILGIAVFGLLCSAVLAYLFVRQIIRPLRQLIKRMRQLEKGDFDTRVKLSFTEEYAHLAYGFNHMASQLTMLMEQVKEESRAKREAQTSLLEAQIKPHFLYNTLDMIHWRALDYEAKDISRMIVQLSKLLRIGLSGGRLFIRVRDELEHARCYVSIQSERLPFSIQYEERIDPRIRGCHIPKIILQPFIENAVMHGHPSEGRCVSRYVSPRRMSLLLKSQYESRIMDKVCQKAGIWRKHMVSVFAMCINAFSCTAGIGMAYI